MGVPLNLIGQRFGRLTVQALHGLDRFKRRMWKCQCDCGKHAIVQAGNLRTGNTKSCGCFEDESRRSSETKITKFYVGREYICRCGKPFVVTDVMKRYRQYKCRGCASAISVENSRRHREVRHKARLKYLKRNPLVPIAHRLVSAALKRGDLQKKPCEVCGETHRVQAHHDDYSKPLEVKWFCGVHHAARHMELRNGRLS